MDFGDTPHIIGMGISEYSGHKKLYSPSLILTCMAAKVSRYHSITLGHPVKNDFLRFTSGIHEASISPLNYLARRYRKPYGESCPGIFGPLQ